MKITENTKLKIGTLLKDNTGYSIVIDYDKQNDCYILVECDEFILTMFNQYGMSIFKELEDGKFDDRLVVLQVEDLIELNAEIIDRLSVYNKEIKCYNIKIFEKTTLNEHHYKRTIERYDINEAIELGRKEVAKGNRVRIEEVLNIVNW